jgi:hypothetical protein
MNITVYSFETEDDEVATDYETQNLEAARVFAKKNGYSLIANEYEWSDAELLEDYRPGHNFDGTLTEDPAKE